MKIDGMTLTYPQNAYYKIFGKISMPADAEPTLDYIVKTTIDQKLAEIFMLRYKHELTLSAIGARCGGFSAERARQLIAKVERKLRHPSRSRMLKQGREAHLAAIAAANDELMQQYVSRIAALEARIREQEAEMAKYRNHLVDLHTELDPSLEVLCMGIEILDLSCRSYNCLYREGVKTIEDLVNYGDLLGVRNLGQKSVQEIQNRLQALLRDRKQGASSE